MNTLGDALNDFMQDVIVGMQEGGRFATNNVQEQKAEIEDFIEEYVERIKAELQVEKYLK